MPKTGSTFQKTKKFFKVCRYCGGGFKAADIKAATCNKCKRPKPCLCGCGKFVINPKAKWAPGHAITKAVQEGHKKQAEKIKGDKNPSKTKECRKKLKRSLTKYWSGLSSKRRKERLINNSFCNKPLTNARRRQDGYRSILELRVAKICEKYQIPFEYEKEFRFKNGKRYYPDFEITINQKILIEVSGFAYEAWKRSVISRVQRLKSEGHTVICVTYSSASKEMSTRVPVPVFTIKGFSKWLRSKLQDV